MPTIIEIARAYILRGEAYGALQEHFTEGGFKNYTDGQKCMNRIKAIPAADVEEVVHASWVAENSRPKSGIFYCSCCHRTCYDPQPTRAKGWTKRCRYHYCPSCGAKMDGGQDDV